MGREERRVRERVIRRLEGRLRRAPTEEEIDRALDEMLDERRIGHDAARAPTSKPRKRRR